jgi:hypothetical protein
MSKDILFLTTLKFKPVRKDRPFYDRFDYCLAFHLDEISCLKILDHAHIDDMIERRKQWREIAQQRWKNGGRSHATILGSRWREITAKTADDLHVLATVLLSTSAEFKLVVSMNQGYVYSNDLNLLHQLDQLPELNFKTYTQSQIVRPKNTIQLRNPRHQYRTYLTMCKLTAQQRHNLEEFFISQSAHVRLSPALVRWIDLPFNRTQDYFFVDHDSESWATMLSLVQPGIIRKTMHIIPAK